MFTESGCTVAVPCVALSVLYQTQNNFLQFLNIWLGASKSFIDFMKEVIAVWLLTVLLKESLHLKIIEPVASWDVEVQHVDMSWEQCVDPDTGREWWYQPASGVA